jgi:hypothetical protein
VSVRLSGTRIAGVPVSPSSMFSSARSVSHPALTRRLRRAPVGVPVAGRQERVINRRDALDEGDCAPGGWPPSGETNAKHVHIVGISKSAYVQKTPRCLYWRYDRRRTRRNTSANDEGWDRRSVSRRHRDGGCGAIGPLRVSRPRRRPAPAVTRTQRPGSGGSARKAFTRRAEFGAPNSSANMGELASARNTNKRFSPEF